MRKPVIALVLVLLFAMGPASAAPRTVSQHYLGPRPPLPQSTIATLLCVGGRQRARPGGACIPVDPSDTGVTIDVQDFTTDVAEGAFSFYDAGMMRIPKPGGRMCGPTVTVAVPEGAAFLVVLPAVHVYPLALDTCRFHPREDVAGVAGVIVATFS